MTITRAGSERLFEVAFSQARVRRKRGGQVFLGRRFQPTTMETAIRQTLARIPLADGGSAGVVGGRRHGVVCLVLPSSRLKQGPSPDHGELASKHVERLRRELASLL